MSSNGTISGSLLFMTANCNILIDRRHFNYRSILFLEVSSRKQKSMHPNSVSTRSAALIILAIFICSISALFYVYMKFPKLDE